MKVIAALLTTVLLFSIPVAAVFADLPDLSGEVAKKAEADAERDVKTNISATAWFAAGFFCGGASVLYALTHRPFIHYRRHGLTYRRIYHEAYMEKVKAKYLKCTAAGCLTRWAAAAALICLIARYRRNPQQPCTTSS